MPYAVPGYELLFDRRLGAGESTAPSRLKEGIFRYRVKTIKSGPVLECEIFPIWRGRDAARKARQHMTRDAQKRLNEKNAKKAFIRKINANFTDRDLCVTLTYSNDYVPDETQARKDMQNYIRRLKNYRRKKGLPELKYAYVIEYEIGEGKYKKQRVHHHLIVSGMDRDVIEKLWGRGYANCRRLQPDEYGLEALARYMLKGPKGSKRWCASKNLKKSVVTTSDKKISHRRVSRLAGDIESAGNEIFEKLYPGYLYNKCTIYQSDFVTGVYIYTSMRRRE